MSKSLLPFANCLEISGKRTISESSKELLGEEETTAHDSKKSHVKTNPHARSKYMKLRNREVESADIDELLGTEPVSKRDEDEMDGKTVSIAELDMIFQDDEVDTNQNTPQKKRVLAPCLASGKVVSAKHIHFGKRATLDFQENAPAVYVSPQLQRVESDISTRPSAITELDYPEGLETSRNSSILAQFDDEPEYPNVRRETRESHGPRDSLLPFVDDSFEGSDVEHVRRNRETADLKELNDLLRDDDDDDDDGMVANEETVRVSKLSSMLRESVSMHSPRLTDLLCQMEQDESGLGERNQSVSVMDVEETVALQDLLEVADTAVIISEGDMDDCMKGDAAFESSQMDISMNESETSVIESMTDVLLRLQQSNESLTQPCFSHSNRESLTSRRSTLCLGDMKNALMKEFDRYERRSSLLPQQDSEPITHTLPTKALSILMKQQNNRGDDRGDDDEEEDDTIDLQQISTQLKDQLNHQLYDKTSLTLSRMSASFDKVSQDIDHTVTEDLRRLSQLLSLTGDQTVNQSQELSVDTQEIPTINPHFSPLLTQQSKQVIVHEVKSSQKYGGAETPRISVVDMKIRRILFQGDESETPAYIEENKEQEVIEKILGNSETEVSLNLDEYFLPSTSHSLLVDSVTCSQDTVSLESSESISDILIDNTVNERPIRMDSFARPSLLPLPSPIKTRESKESKESKELKESKDRQMEMESSLSPIKMNREINRDNSDSLSSLSFTYSPPDWVQHSLSHLHTFIHSSTSHSQSNTYINFHSQHILNHQSITHRLQQLRQDINRQERRIQSLTAEQHTLHTQQQELQNRLQTEREIQTVQPINVDVEGMQKKKEEEQIGASVRSLLDLVNCDVRIINERQFVLMMKKKIQAIAQLEVRFVEAKRVKVKVVLHPSIRTRDQQQLKERLPIQTEWVFSVSELKERITRCWWILFHTL